MAPGGVGGSFGRANPSYLRTAGCRSGELSATLGHDRCPRMYGVPIARMESGFLAKQVAAQQYIQSYCGDSSPRATKARTASGQAAGHEKDAVHGQTTPPRTHRVGNLISLEMTALIGVDDFGHAEAGERLLDHLAGMTGLQRNGHLVRSTRRLATSTTAVR